MNKTVFFFVCFYVALRENGSISWFSLNEFNKRLIFNVKICCAICLKNHKY